MNRLIVFANDNTRCTYHGAIIRNVDHVEESIGAYPDVVAQRNGTENLGPIGKWYGTYGSRIVIPDQRRMVTAQISCNGLDRDWLKVELYADALSPDGASERLAMTAAEDAANNTESCVYRVEVTTQRALADYTVRVLPDHPEAQLPLDLSLVTWEH